MTASCGWSPQGAQHTHPVGDRWIDVQTTVHWGDQDPRADHAKTIRFCSFRCLSLWAASRADQHDPATAPEAA